VTKTITRAFDRDWLIGEDIPWSDYEVSTEIVDTGGRWMDEAQCVFQMPDDGFYYMLTYEVGKTEYQEVDWHDNLDAVENLPRVELVEKTIVVKEWMPVTE
jgi:hypothetical protein